MQKLFSLVTFFSLILLVLNQPAMAKLSKVAESKCENKHGGQQLYDCFYNEDGSLKSMLRYDPRKKPIERQNLPAEKSFYKSKFVTFYHDEILKKIFEYSEVGNIIRELNFDTLGVLEHEIKRDENGQLSLIRQFINSTSFLRPNVVHHNLSEKHIYSNGIYQKGMKLEGHFDENRSVYTIERAELYNHNYQIEQAIDNSELTACPENNKNKIKVIVFEETGVDVNHPALKNKMYSHGKELIDGIDNDGNGLIDDCGGFSITKRAHNRVLVDPPLSKQLELTSIDHGTKVVDLLTRNNDEITFLPVSGQLTATKYYEYGLRVIQDEDVSFANMSFQFRGNKSSRHSPPEQNFSQAIIPLLNMLNRSPETLFVVGAGNGIYGFGSSNGGVSIDVVTGQYPAAASYNNVFVVGSIDSNTIDPAKMSVYKMSNFSNYGLKNVDILAPGEGFDLHLPGGYSKSHSSGTSYSTPYVLNYLTKAKAQLPSLTIYQLKELAMKTVYIPSLDVALVHFFGHKTLESKKKKVRDMYLKENPLLLPVRSGGIFYPERFLLAAKEFASNMNQGINESVFKARRQLSLNLQGESHSSKYFRDLDRLWKQRELNESSFTPFKANK